MGRTHTIIVPKHLYGYQGARIGDSIAPKTGESESQKKSILLVKSQRSFFVKKMILYLDFKFKLSK